MHDTEGNIRKMKVQQVGLKFFTGDWLLRLIVFMSVRVTVTNDCDKRLYLIQSNLFKSVTQTNVTTAVTNIMRRWSDRKWAN